MQYQTFRSLCSELWQYDILSRLVKLSAPSVELWNYKNDATFNNAKNASEHKQRTEHRITHKSSWRPAAFLKENLIFITNIFQWKKNVINLLFGITLIITHYFLNIILSSETTATINVLSTDQTAPRRLQNPNRAENGRKALPKPGTAKNRLIYD